MDQPVTDQSLLDFDVRIKSFTGDYRFLSNFYRLPAPIEIYGHQVHTIEHGYQVAKTSDRAQQLTIVKANTPAIAKQRGRHVTLRPNWDRIKISIMLQLLYRKFDNKVLGAALQATGTRYLLEGNDWGDKFWGVDHRTLQGKNWLGLLLMHVRDTI